MTSHDVSAVPFKSFQEKGQLNCYPHYAIFSWRGSSHSNTSRKPLGHLSPHDSSPVTLWLSAVGRTEAGYHNGTRDSDLSIFFKLVYNIIHFLPANLASVFDPKRCLRIFV